MNNPEAEQRTGAPQPCGVDRGLWQCAPGKDFRTKGHLLNRLHSPLGQRHHPDLATFQSGPVQSCGSSVGDGPVRSRGSPTEPSR